MDFTHLHLHTEYSLLDGTARISDIIDRAKQLNMHSIAITDHGAMYGVVDFYKKAVETGIKPIIGCEVYVAPGRMADKTKDMKEYSHLVLLAKDNAGYKNLMRLSSIAFTQGFYHKPRIDYEVLEQYKVGLICLSACLAGDIQRMILSGDTSGADMLAIRLRDMFGGDFYLELQDHFLPEQKQVNAAIIDMSNRLSIPVVATNDVHYTYKEDAQAQDVLLCIQTRAYVEEKNRMKFGTDEFYLKSSEEMAFLFRHIPEAIDNTLVIAEKCNITMDFGAIHLPEFTVPGEISHAAYLKNICFDGLAQRYDAVTDILKERLEYELEIIDHMGFTDYFLIVWDFIKFARDNGIMVGPGRGSAAGSLAAYTLRITDIDPIEYSLLFERFLNPDRISMPDIDIDFCIERRQEVIDYVVRKYGEDRVAQIITFGTLGAKQVIRDVARAQKVPLADADRIAKMVPFALKMTISRALQENDRLMMEYRTKPEIKNLIDTAMKLEGIPRHASTHAAGVVISRLPVTEYVPLQINPRDGSVITQFPMTTLESLGLLKMDFLGLRNLTVIRHTIETVRQTRGEDIRLENLRFDDEKVFELIASGDTDGVFQLESAGMRGLMQRLKPTNLGDIMVGISLFRPGPMDSIPAYLEAKAHPDKLSYEHPKLKRILSETYGCMVYQEQVMEIVRDLAGYSLGRSDLVRRAMAKKKKDVMEKERRIFVYGDESRGVEGAVKRGVSAKVAERIFDQMMDFAEYAFNKSHACAYAAIAYYTAYLKCHYKVEYLTALLNSFIGTPDKISAYIQYCTSAGITLLTPDINKSQFLFSVEGNAIRFGFAAIRDVGRAAEEIVKERQNCPYTSFRGFINRTVDSINKKMLEGMIIAGCFDSLGIKRSQLMAASERVLKSAQEAKKRNIEGQVSLFDALPALGYSDADDYPNIAEYAKEKLLTMEKIATGVYLSGHPLDQYKVELEERDINIFKIMSATEDVNSAKYFESRVVELVGILIGIRRRSTKQKKMMANAFLEDLYGTIELVIFPSVYQKCELFLVDDSIVRVTGKVDIREGEVPQLLAENIVPFDRQDASYLDKNLFIRIPKDMGESTDSLKRILKTSPGTQRVTVMVEKTGKKIRTGNSLNVSVTGSLIKSLVSEFGSENVVVK
ncbi:MAG: DNA polymerase III subunit alpha [Christensenellales bacterium]|jgi:DNA polymerase-3 subunit alpha